MTKYSILLLSLAFAPAAFAQLPGGASDYAPTSALVVNTSTQLQLPDDGILAFTSITIASGATLTFAKPQSGSNPPVHLLSTGAVDISGTIDVSANGRIGGPGGFDGGRGAPSGEGEPGYGPGGGSPGPGSYGEGAKTYGSPFLLPLIGGSGASGTTSDGGGGGGAIAIASDVRIDQTGTVRANGSGQGASGAVRLVAPVVVVTGILQSSNSADGRLRVDAADLSGVSPTVFGAPFTTGHNLFVQLPSPPSLSFVEVAGTLTGGSDVEVLLPFGAPNPQTLVLRATNIPATQEVVVALKCPGPSESILGPVTFDTAAAWPQERTLSLVIPPNLRCRVEAFSRPVGG